MSTPMMFWLLGGVRFGVAALEGVLGEAAGASVTSLTNGSSVAGAAAGISSTFCFSSVTSLGSSLISGLAMVSSGFFSFSPLGAGPTSAYFFSCSPFAFSFNASCSFSASLLSIAFYIYPPSFTSLSHCSSLSVIPPSPPLRSFPSIQELCMKVIFI